MRILEIFKELAKVPNCSEDTCKYKEFIKNFSKDLGEVKEDKAGNILVTVGQPKICLQGHYDMVCIDTDGVVEVVEDGNILKGNSSSLGADNGIAIAMMLALIEEKISGEYLFTNDEEIGLIGANNLELEVQSKKILNLDEEREGIITIGCAGGFDAHIKANIDEVSCDNQDFYQITIDGLPGGHSGIEIHKTIPNALKKIVHFASSFSKSIAFVQSGERHNSIPRSGKIVVGVEKGFSIPFHNEIKVEKVPTPKVTYNVRLLDLLMVLPHGVLGWLDEYGMASKSVNLAIVKQHEIILSYRAMTNELLQELKNEVRSLAKILEVDCKIETSYSAWEPIQSQFAKEVQSYYGKDCTIEVIHAGLEGAVLKEKFPHADIVSIGPNIHHPHTSNEYAEIDSCERVYQVVKKIMDKS
ncbi:MAG: M20/M25/M40 family metallo-hydrolase [Campylobacterales bacterium]|nr:M20/M25/M40 family metallo-hydrolase [Campylobacterales bacterium]